MMVSNSAVKLQSLLWILQKILFPEWQNKKLKELHTCAALFLFLILMIHSVSNTFICCLLNLAVIPFCCALKLVETVMVQGEEQVIEES